MPRCFEIAPIPTERLVSAVSRQEDGRMLRGCGTEKHGWQSRCIAKGFVERPRKTVDIVDARRALLQNLQLQSKMGRRFLGDRRFVKRLFSKADSQSERWGAK